MQGGGAGSAGWAARAPAPHRHGAWASRATFVPSIANPPQDRAGWEGDDHHNHPKQPPLGKQRQQQSRATHPTPPHVGPALRPVTVTAAKAAATTSPPRRYAEPRARARSAPWEPVATPPAAVGVRAAPSMGRTVATTGWSRGNGEGVARGGAPSLREPAQGRGRGGGGVGAAAAPHPRHAQHSPRRDVVVVCVGAVSRHHRTSPEVGSPTG